MFYANYFFKKLKYCIWGSAIIIGLFIFCSPAYAGEMKMTSFYVGRGDAILIESKGKYMLVDSGTAENAANLVKSLQDMGITYIDYIVSTHPDGDHSGGFADIFETFEVGFTYYSPCTKELQSYYNFFNAMEKSGCGCTCPKTGDSWTLGDATVKVVYDGSLGTTYNECSIVLKVSCDNKSILLTGDLPSTMEKRLLAANYDVKCNILKVGHHGASASSCASFLDAASPEIAVISCNKKETASLPNDKVLKRLTRRNVSIYRTSTNGNFSIKVKDGVISCDGKSDTKFINFSSATLSLSNTRYINDGKKKRPMPKVVLNGQTIPPSEYKVSYSKNVHTGIATVKVVGNEKKYLGTLKTKFYILPHQSYIKSALLKGKTSVILTWYSQKYISKFQVQYSTDKSFKKSVKTAEISPSKLTRKAKNLKKGKKYYFRVRSYTEDVGYGKWSKKEKVKIPKPKKKKKKKSNDSKKVTSTKNVSKKSSSKKSSSKKKSSN